MHPGKMINPVIVLTRETEDNQALAAGLQAKHIEVLHYPCIQTVFSPFSPSSHLPEGKTMADFQVIVFTSKRGVAGMQPVYPLIREHLRTGMRIAVVGQATAGAVKNAIGTFPHYIAQPATSQSLARLLVRSLPTNTSILHIRGDKTTGAFKSIIHDHKFPLTEAVVYRTQSTNPQPLKSIEQAIIVLSSPSTVQTFFSANPRSGRPSQWIYLSIGPTTTQALQKTGVTSIFQAKSPGNIIEAIENIILINTNDE